MQYLAMKNSSKKSKIGMKYRLCRTAFTFRVNEQKSFSEEMTFMQRPK